MQVQSIGAFDEHEDVVFVRDSASGLEAIIAIHDTTRGPALGGCRMHPYAKQSAALDDVLRLSRGMTFKNALAGLPLGGGKAVIIADPASARTPELLAAFGRAVEALDGRYITAEDCGIGVGDVEVMRGETAHVRGIGEGGVGDPSPHTAHGVMRGMMATASVALGRDDLGGVRIAVQGLGKVGWDLCERLHGAGAHLVVCDLRADRVSVAVSRFDAEVAVPAQVHAADVDILAPCAMGAVLNERTIPEIRARAVAGSANNQLGEPEDGERLRRRGILHAPDFAINAGGVIAIAHEGPGFDANLLEADIRRIGLTLARIYARAARAGRATSQVAEELARERLEVRDDGAETGHGTDAGDEAPLPRRAAG